MTGADDIKVGPSTDMLTLRDKLRIPLIFMGILLIASGFGIAYPGIKKSSPEFRFGAGKDMNLTAAIPQEAAPWVIGAGFAVLVTAYFTREK
jgi:hypothetical protein